MNHLFICLLAAFLLSHGSVQHKAGAPEINTIIIEQQHVPLFCGRQNKEVLKCSVEVPDGNSNYELESIVLFIKEDSQTGFLKSVEVRHRYAGGDDESASGFGKAIRVKNNRIKVDGSLEMAQGKHTFSFQLNVRENVHLTEHFSIERVEMKLKGGGILAAEADAGFAYRPAKVLRAAGQDHCDTYRIPGLVTTNKGTLIAVYDIRYNNSKDLQENIDIGMSRSTDGGQSWEPMQVIMDMGKWGGRSERLNGIGDPCVLYDPDTHTLWVAGLWMSGATEKDMLWWASRPGLEPEQTGQFVVVKSTDDGLNWSAPINLTEQIKDPEWQLLLQGPGRGITLRDGTLVFPAQFKADIGNKSLDGGAFTAHSTIVYSKDKGKTWHIGTGAKPNTTEAQVVQLADGRLMLNMRDDRNRRIKDEGNGRAVAVTADMGKTWTLHPSSNSALPEPNCMASLIAANVEINHHQQQVLFFSNPNNREARTNMTIKASLDGGLTWPEKFWVELNETKGFGYSCLTMVDEHTLGIVYEGEKELYFQKIPVKEVLRKK